MDNLYLSFSVVFPLFSVLVLGYLLRIIKIFDVHSLNVFNNAVFKVFLPALLFYNVYQTKIEDVFNPKLMLYAVSAVFVSFVLFFIIVPIFEKNNKKRGVMIQGMFRSNFVLFGIPVAISLFGSDGAGIASVLIAVVVPMYNLLAVVALEVFRGKKINVGKIIKGIVSNPLIIASCTAVGFLALRIKIPDVLEKALSEVTVIATPLALIILGGTFEFNKLKGNILEMAVSIFGKLIVLPGLGIFFGILIGFRGIELGILLTMFAAPTAVSSFTMAQQMDGDSVLAGQIVVGSTLFSILTMFIWIFILKQTAYI